ncbi:MAG: glycosyltransferase family 39 protein [Candidatus Hydrogenedentes bacterium]|nr:glycosyltransferase family 39 protein [Candidatus Hydrogenedentota bacterium]
MTLLEPEKNYTVNDVTKDRGAAKAAVWALGVIVLLAAALRLHDLNYSLWEDEFLTQLRASKSIAGIWAIYEKPVYYSAVWAISGLGDSEALLRLPSVFFAVLTVILMYVAGRDAGGRGAGLVAALLLALSAYHLRYSQEARYYALLMLATLAACWILHRAISRGRIWDWIGFTLIAAVAMRTHLFAVVALAGLAAGACLWLLVARIDGGWRRRLARLALVVLCLIAADAGSSGPRLLKAAGIEIGAPLEPIKLDDTDAQPGAKQQFRLSPTEYLSFYRTYFPHAAGVQILFVLLGLIGLAVLFQRESSMAAMLAGVTLVPPLPFFFMNTNHFFHDRYFSFEAIFGLLLAAVGGTALAQWAGSHIARYLASREAATPSDAGRVTRDVLATVMAAVMLALYAPQAVSALERQYRARPVRDYKGLAQHMAKTLQPGDAVYFAGPDDRLWFPLQYALASEVPSFANQHLWLSSNRASGMPGEEAIMEFVSQYPERNVWFLSRLQDIGSVGERLDRLGASPHRFGELYSWVFGAPTANLIRRGGMEGLSSDQVDRPGITLTGPEEAFAGEHAIRIDSDAPGDVQISFALQAPAWSLRNPSFAAWQEGAPRGWQVYPHADAAAPTVDGKGAPALALTASDETVIVRQAAPHGLAPGKSVLFTAMGQASEPQSLALVLKWEAAGIPQQQQVLHPGGGQWAEMKLTAAIPPEADPESITVEVQRLPGAATNAALVRGLRLALQPRAIQLDPLKTYTVSLMLKYEDVRWAKEFAAADPPHAAQLVLMYRDTKTKKNNGVHLLRFSGTSPWRQVTFLLKPGENLPIDAVDLKLFASIYSGTGAVWLDDVQVEEGSLPTPFAASRRLPHDEAFAMQSR